MQNSERMEALPYTCTFGTPPTFDTCGVSDGGILSNGKRLWSGDVGPHLIPGPLTGSGPFPGPPSDSWETHGESK